MKIKTNSKDNNRNSAPVAVAERPQPEKDQKSDDMQQEVHFTEDGVVDKLQGTVYNTGTRMLSVLKDKKLIDEQDAGYAQARTALKELGRFSYNIGFAGEQSCGKSTVINSLLRYPLMPTCKLTTTAVVVQLAYSDHLRVRAVDGDSGKTVLDYNCEMPKDAPAQKKFRERFEKLLDYGVDAMRELVMETFQPFTDIAVRSTFPKLSDMDMSPENPRHVMILLFVLLAVYVGQNDESWDEQKEKLMEKRTQLFRFLGIPAETVNISIFAQADFELLRSGLVITDLPGLGSNAASRVINGRKVKGHDDITKEAIQACDAMVFLSTPENRQAGYKVLTEMLSNAKIKQAVYKGDRIIAVLNKADTCQEAERITVLKSFCNALASVGVNKEPTDIILYSGISGELRFEEVPFERTLLYKQEVDEDALRAKALRRGKDFEELRKDVVDDLKDDAEESYKQSGIENLLRLFRTSYVEQGKYIKSTAALQALREMVVSTVNSLEQIAKNYDLLCQSQNALQTGMVEKVKTAVEKPLATSQTQIDKEISRTGISINKELGLYTNGVADLYIKAFEAGLAAYKNSLVECMRNFDLTWLGLGSKARIDVPGSRNRQIYLNLLEKMKELPVSLTEVNLRYEKILDIVRTKIDRFYEDALDGLAKLSDDTRRSLDEVIVDAKKSSISDEEIATLEILKEQMVAFVEMSLDLVKNQFNRQQNATTKAMQNVVKAIFDLNDKMVTQFTSATTGELEKRLSKGGIFVSKDFVMIDGSDGLKAAVNRLGLTDQEEDVIRLNVDAGVNSIVKNEITTWTNDLYTIVSAYSTLQGQIQAPMEDMIKSMGDSVEKNADKAKALREQISAWKETVQALNEAVCPTLKEACTYINDREPVNIQMQENVFFGCIN